MALDPNPPYPVAHPVMYQDWETLTFLHWRYDAAAIQQRLPAGLEVDMFDGTAWVALVPFCVTNLRPSFGPALPWLSHFPETNVRTYVRGRDGAAGIWFFTLEAARLAAVIGARASFGLPYRWARMRVDLDRDRAQYSSRRNPHTEIHVRIGDRVRPNDLEIFLTARFRLYTTLLGKLAYANVNHEPWPLFRASVERMDEDLMRSLGFSFNEAPLAHYSPGVHTRMAAPCF